MADTGSDDITPWGRRIHGPTLPGQGVRCARQSPLTEQEVDEAAAIIARGRRERHSVALPERLRTRDWGSVVAVMERANERLGWPAGGWKIGAASVEVQRAEGVPGPAPGRLRRDAIFASPARLPRSLFINYRCSECEFAFRMAADLPPRDRPYTDGEVADAVAALMPAVEIGDTVFDDWYGASGYLGSLMDNGGAAALVHGAPVTDWRGLDLPNTRVDLSLNGRHVKSGHGRAAMGHPLTSLTWMVNWLRERGRTLRAGEVVSTGTCTGHFFAAPGDRLDVDYGPVGRVVVEYE
jgi:2-keto-4-pentenoate hydratase